MVDQRKVNEWGGTVSQPAPNIWAKPHSGKTRINLNITLVLKNVEKKMSLGSEAYRKHIK